MNRNTLLPESITAPQPFSDEVVFNIAKATEQQMKDSLTYVAGESIDNIETTKRGDCIGYTLLGSLALERTGVNHSIMFANGHASILVPTSDNIRYTDMLTPYLSGMIKDDLFLYINSPSNRQLATLSTASIIDRSSKDWHTTIAQHPWLRQKLAREYDRHAGGHSLIASIFSPDNGRKSIYHFKKFNEAYDQKNLENAGQSLVTMGDLFPEINIKSDFYKKVKKTVKRLAIAKNHVLAQEATAAIFNNFDFSKDSRIQEYEADCLRYIAQYANKPGLARHAIDLYQRAKEHPKSLDKSLSKKIEICKSLTPQGEF